MAVGEIVSIRTGIGSATGVADADPILTELIRHALNAAAKQMGLVLQRTAFSPVIYEVLDYAAALYDRDLRLLAQADSLPMFLGTMSFCIEAAVERIGGVERLVPGDVIFSTYAYDIGSHQQDAAVVVPAFLDEELVGYATIKAHQMDIGAKAVYCTDTTDIFQEGMILPSVRLYRGGELQEDLWRTMLANSRMPRALAGDVTAMITAAKTGTQGLLRLIDRHGLDSFRLSVERMFDHAETLTRKAIEAVPDGRYVGRGAIDSNGITDDLIPLEVAVEVCGSNVVVDFSASPPEQPGPINCPLPTTVSAARVAMMAFAMGQESANEGHFRPFEVRTRAGTLFHPRPPVPVFMYWWPAAIAVDLIHRALSDAMPGAIPAGSGGDLCVTSWWGVMDDGTFWVDNTDHAVGVGATCDSDGGGPLMHITGSGIRNPPVEVWEARHPLLVENFEYAQDSAGVGRYRGGLGTNIHYRALRDCNLTVAWERTKTPPWGLHGGRDARPSHFEIRYPDGTTATYGKVTALRVPVGTVVEVHTGGGGGFGPPEQRSPSAVHTDLREGYVSEAAARRDYPHAFREPT
jgi:N-methylhydantoinase B